MFLSYRNQSVDLQIKSTDWFLYDGNIGRQRVKTYLICQFCKSKNYLINSYTL